MKINKSLSNIFESRQNDNQHFDGVDILIFDRMKINNLLSFLSRQNENQHFDGFDILIFDRMKIDNSLSDIFLNRQNEKQHFDIRQNENRRLVVIF